MNNIELFAWIIIVASIIKMIVVLFSPGSWKKFAMGVYSKPKLISILALILSGVVLYYLMQAGITITEILAVALFVALLFMVGLASYAQRLIKSVNIKQIIKEQWYYVLLWLVLIIAGIMELNA